jgi:GT2 family glycosyltransferase
VSTAVSSFWTQTRTTESSDVTGGTPTRQWVSAVLVSHDGARWLPEVLDSLRAADLKPDSLVAVDTGSTDDSVDLLENSPVVDQVLLADSRCGFGEAARLGLAAGQDTIDLTDSAGEVTGPAAEGGANEDSATTGAPATGGSRRGTRDTNTRQPDPSGSPDHWVWLLHDDCAVAPDTLAELLTGALANPDSWVIGPKVHRWRRREIIDECGVSYTAYGRRITGIERSERDQGQYDHRSDVYTVASAGMLVRRDVWERLSGFTSSFPLFGDDHDFCYRVRRSGGRIHVATKSVVFHRGAAASNRRNVGSKPRSAIRAERRAVNLIVLAHVPLWRLPFSMLRIALTGVVGAVLAVAGFATGSAWEQLAGAFGPIFNVRALWRARRAVARSARVSRGEVRDQRRMLSREGSYWQEAVPRFLDHGSRSSMRSIRQRAHVLVNWAVAVLLPLAAVSVVATRSLWVGPGQLHGGALLPAPDGVGSMWSVFLASWHEVGLGSDVASPPFLALLSAIGIGFLGSTTAAVQTMLLLGPVFAGTAAFVALRGLTTGLPRIAGSVVYGLAPAVVAAVGTGRLATLAVGIMLPLVARGMARVSGVAGSHLPPAGWSTVAAVGLGVAVLGAFSPPVAVLLIVLGLIWAVFATRRGGSMIRTAVVAAVPMVLLWPWSGYLFSNPGLLRLDIGASVAELGSSPALPWQLVILDPGGPAAPPTGLGVFLLGLAVAASFNVRIRKVVLLAWTAALAGLLLGSWQAVTQVPVPASASGQSAWPGSATMVVAAAFVVLAVAAAAHPMGMSRPDKVSDGTARQLQFRYSRGVIGPSIALLGVVILSAWWVLDQEHLVEHSDATAVSPFIATKAFGPDAPRTLILAGAGKDTYEYLLVSGVGPVLGDSETAPPSETMALIDQSVSRLASGGGSDDLRVLAEASVQYVQADTRSDRELSRQLDAVPGMSRVSSVGSQAVWEIQGWEPRARGVTNDGASLPVPVTFTSSGAVEVSTEIAESSELAGLTLAESPSLLWRAVAGESAMEPVSGTDLQTFTIESPILGPAYLAASVDQDDRQSDLIVPAAGLGIVVLAGVWHLLRVVRLKRAQARSSSRRRARRSRPADVAVEVPS